MNSSPTIVHTSAGLSPHSGGTSRVIVDLLDSLVEQTDFSPVLVTQGLDGEPTVASANTGVHRIVATTYSRGILKTGWPFAQALRSVLNGAPTGLLHSHGVWLPVNHWAARAARRYRIPLIIQPHGMLEPWAIKHKAWKKRLALSLYQQRDLATARVLVATAEQEYANLRALGLRQPIAIIPNGVHLPLTGLGDTLPSRAAGATRTVLFLGRVYPVKGLLYLIEAWARLQPMGWRLQIAGPDEAGHLAEVLALALRLGVAEAVDYVGAVEGAAKSALYRQADVFVLPTFSENFGVVVAEALAHGLPVITTKGAPWADLETFECGWWIDIGVDPLAAALGQAMALTDAERQAMGARGRDYVRRYDWADIARQTAEVYRWVLGRGSLPACVRLA